jgi:hypothetical protein
MKKLLFLLICISMIVIACKKNELGGKSSIKGKVVHHSKAIANAIVYIKFDSKESAGTDVTKYDTKVTADVNGNYEIPSLYKGDYYLYAVGEDFAIPPPYTVNGGIPVVMRTKESISIDVPVTEGD